MQLLSSSLRAHLMSCSKVMLSNAVAQSRRSFSSIYTSLHTPNPNGPPAFAFDIDGVLIRGKNVLDQAKSAMAKLCPDGHWAFPVVFLTNGGGVSEGRKAEQLSGWLGVPVSDRQVILSHSPMRQLVPKLGNQPVLLSGRGDVLNVARSYGFNRVITTEQLAARWPAAVPFIRKSGSQHTEAAPAPVHDEPAAQAVLGSEEHPFKAVIVMSDPSNWYLDLQLILDTLHSRGVPTRKHAPSHGHDPVELYFSNPDLLWSNEHPRNRFGQGAFAHIVMSLYKELAGVHQLDFPVKFFGKPNAEPYRLAEQLLLEQAVRLGLVDTPTHTHVPASGATQQPHTRQLPFSAIYAVGDNPAADVRGANSAGAPWVSVLVKTGVFQGPGDNCSRDAAKISVTDVAAAVEAALHRTRSHRFHSMR